MVQMRKRGFLPLTALGLILLVLSAAVTSFYLQNEHQDKMSSINRTSISSLTNSAASKRKDIKRQARNVLYKALWKVGKKADAYKNKSERESRIENIASIKLEKILSNSIENQIKTFSSPKLKLENKNLNLEIKKGKNGRVIAKIKLSKGSSIYNASPDNSFSINLSNENLKTKVGPRFFLLQNRMNKFGNNLEKIKKRWKYAEYVLAYIQAWGGGKVNLSEKRSKALFQIALASHEIDKFGSTDYRAIRKDLSNCLNGEELINSYSKDVVVKPLKNKEIQKITNEMGNSLSQIQKSSKELRSASEELRKIAQFQTEKWFENELEKISNLQNSIETKNNQNLKKEFRKICQDFRTIYNFPEKQIEKTLQKLQKTKKSVQISREKIRNGSKSIEKLSQNNPLMKQLYENFTKKGKTPGILPQIEIGTKNVLENLKLLEKRTRKIKDSYNPPNSLTSKFPANFEKRFNEAIEENNENLAKNILSKASKSAGLAFDCFSKNIENNLEKIKPLHSLSTKEIQNQVKVPSSNWQEEYKDYPDPGSDTSKKAKQKTAKKFVIYPNKGTIKGIEKVLQNAKNHLKQMKKINKKFKKARKGLKKFDLDKDLKKQLNKNTKPKPVKNLTREQLYEISPPKPLKSSPGISVYHEIEIEEVNYDRLDPVGLVLDHAPTPIYLWFISTTIYWAMWDVEIKLDKPLVEEIFDYQNQSIPRPITEGSSNYLHKALPYKQEFQKTKFEFKLVVLSLRKFEISHNSSII